MLHSVVSLTLSVIPSVFSSSRVPFPRQLGHVAQKVLQCSKDPPSCLLLSSTSSKTFVSINHITVSKSIYKLSPQEIFVAKIAKILENLTPRHSFLEEENIIYSQESAVCVSRPRSAHSYSFSGLSKDEVPLLSKPIGLGIAGC
jgi:hypothetical protein